MDPAMHFARIRGSGLVPARRGAPQRGPSSGVRVSAIACYSRSSPHLLTTRSNWTLHFSGAVLSRRRSAPESTTQQPL